MKKLKNWYMLLVGCKRIFDPPKRGCTNNNSLDLAIRSDIEKLCHRIVFKVVYNFICVRSLVHFDICELRMTQLRDPSPKPHLTLFAILVKGNIFHYSDDNKWHTIDTVTKWEAKVAWFAKKKCLTLRMGDYFHGHCAQLNIA